MSNIITDVTIKNIGAAQANVPFTFGQVFAVGDLKAGEAVTGALASGVAVPLQFDVKASHADGSVRHAIISGVLAKAAADEAIKLQLVKASAQPSTAAFTTSKTDASVVLKIAGVAYSASLADATKSLSWLGGSIANEAIYDAPLKDAQGVAHPRLTARFGIRSYVSGQARVEVVIENTKTWVAASNETYDVDVTVNGRLVYSKTALTHYSHARWRNVVCTDMREMRIILNTAYLISTKAVSNYDQSIKVSESALAAVEAQVASVSTGPMTIGVVNPAMGSTGGRPDIGPLPGWTVMYLLSADERARKAMTVNAEGSGTWSTHYRDETTGYPIRVDNEKNKLLSFHYNMSSSGPLPVPRCVNNDWDLAHNPNAADDSHQPSLVYFPYLISGDYYYLEELHFWAATNPFGTAAGASGEGLGLVRWTQLRGQAWSMRTLGHAAYITPDDHYMKPYFSKMLENNLDYYQKTFLSPDANVMGAYDGTGFEAYVTDGYSPWQDDFFTWSFGYLSELGFEKADPILKWKARYPIGRMTAPGFCWIQASKYFYNYSAGAGQPKYKTFAELYEGNFKEDNIRDDNSGIIKHPQGLKYNDQPCGSEEQANWFKAAGIPWMNKGRMVGYADSTEGYPAILQTSLAVASTSGVENGEKAWALFDSRSAKPDYRKAPQWAIIPRGWVNTSPPPPDEAPLPQPGTPPIPVIPALPVPNPTGGTWSAVGVEGATITLPENTIVRYGAKGVFITVMVSGAFVASNKFFGIDPLPNVVKIVEKFTAAPVTTKLGKIVTPSSTKLLKAAQLRVCLFDAETLETVATIEDVSASSKGVITITDEVIQEGKQYAASVTNHDGKVVLIHYPLIGT